MAALPLSKQEVALLVLPGRHPRQGGGTYHVIVAVHVDEQDEEREEEGPENHPPETEHRQSDDHAEESDQRVYVRQLVL